MAQVAEKRLASSPSAIGVKMPAVYVLLAVATAIAVAVYWTTFVELVRIWDIDPNYSHGFAVPVASVIIAVIAWRRREQPPQFGPVPGATLATGGLLVAGGLLLHLFALFITNLLFDVVSLVLVLQGVLLLAGGRQLRTIFSFAVVFLVFMAPLPAAWYQPIAIAMQQMVSAISSAILEMCGIRVFRQGYLMHLRDGFTMEVGEACSGLRQLTAIAALAAAVGWLANRGVGYRIMLFLLAIPLAILANCLRVSASGLILLWFGRKWAEGVFHMLEGLVVVAIAAALLLLVAWLLLALFPEKNRDEATPVAET